MAETEDILSYGFFARQVGILYTGGMKSHEPFSNSSLELELYTPTPNTTMVGEKRR
jgi:hypothetical protein